MSLPATQTVYRLTAQTSHRDIKPFQEPVPKASPTEVLIKIKAVSLNYRDTVIANGTYTTPIKERVVPASDASGVVIAIGDQVTNLEVGDRVIGNFNTAHLYGLIPGNQSSLGGGSDGGLRQYMVLPETGVTKIPKESTHSWEELAGLPCAGVTAWNCLYGNKPLKMGDTVLMQGTGGVSLIALVLAKAAGATTIVTSSSDKKLEKVKAQWGADYGINYKKTPNWAAEANKITGGRGVDYVIENGGVNTIQQSLECVTQGGQIAAVGFLAGFVSEGMPNIALAVIYKECIIRGIVVGSKQMTEELVRAIVSQDIKIPVDEKIFGFDHEGVMAAYEYLLSGGHMGKICIMVDVE